MVDDERDVVDVITKALKTNGFKVRGFKDPMLALRYFEDGGHSCDIMLADVRMPKMTGFQLVRRIKDMHPESKMILMSSFEIDRSELEKVRLNTEIDGILCKPFAISKLIEMIEDISI